MLSTIVHRIKYKCQGCQTPGSGVACNHQIVLGGSLPHFKITYKFIYIYIYIFESNPHPFYSFRGLKNQMRNTIVCGLDSRSRAGFWKNDGAAVRAVRTIQYNNLLLYLLLIIIYYSSDSPSSLITESLSVLRRDRARLLRKTRFTVPV
jgi:hypothetical protein